MNFKARPATMKQRLKTVWKIVWDTYQAFARDNAARLAAAIAFYAIFSVAPLLIIATAIAGFVFGDKLAYAEIADYLGRMTSVETQQYIFELVDRWQDTTSGVLATIIGVVTLLWGAYKLFMALQDTMNMIWNVRPREDLGVKGWIRLRLVPFSMVLFIGLLLLVSMLVTAVLSTVQEFFADFFTVPATLVNFSNFFVSFLVITVAFGAAFKILPDVQIHWRDVWAGALLTALLFVIGKSLIGVYLGQTSTTSIFGAAGSLVALLFWVYFSAQIFFLGAEFTQVYARHRGANILPDKDAVRVRKGTGGASTSPEKSASHS
jgi:membrane protein